MCRQSSKPKPGITAGLFAVCTYVCPCMSVCTSGNVWGILRVPMRMRGCWGMQMRRQRACASSSSLSFVPQGMEDIAGPMVACMRESGL